jgi:ankyrin repeat protein
MLIKSENLVTLIIKRTCLLLTATILLGGCIQESAENFNEEFPTYSTNSVSQKAEPAQPTSQPANSTTESNKRQNKAPSNSQARIESKEAHNSILLESVREQDLAGVKAALANGADANASNPNAITALMFAALNGNADVFNVLLEADADVNIESGEGETALMYAAGEGHLEMAQILIEKGADIDVQDAGDVGTTALMRAAAGGHIKIVKLLLANHADATTQTPYGDTALTIAQHNGYTEIVELLKKADPHLKKDSIKVNPSTNPPTFDDYPVDTVTLTKHAPIDFDSHPKAYTFRDALKYGIKDGPNFAQHYTIATWGCGTTCQAFAIVDAYTGAVYFPEFVSAVGLDFRLDSNLLVVDPPETIQSTYVPPGVETQYFIWNNKQLLRIE